jgi:hypothetical protein
MSANHNPTPPMRTPCCGNEWETGNHPVYWNPWNKVVQCHNCGQVWQPSFFCDIEDLRALLRNLAWTDGLQTDVGDFIRKYPHLNSRIEDGKVVYPIPPQI